MSILIPSSKDFKYAEQSSWTFSDNVLPNVSVFDISVRCGGSVVSSPIEQGSFFSYNKTNEPMEITATLAFEGTDTFLQSALDRLNKLKMSITLFSIQTPIYEYQNMNLQNFDYSLRREDGLGCLYVNAVFIEIKEVQQSYQNTTITEQQSKDVSAVSTEEGGLQQAEDIEESTSSAIYSAGAESAGTISRKQSLAKTLGF